MVFENSHIAGFQLMSQSNRSFIFLLTAQQTKENNDLNESVKALKTENMDLKAIIDTGYKRIVVLENQVKGFEQRNNHDIKERDSRIAYLTKELNTKSDTIAYLTTQLHQVKLKHASKRSKNTTVGEVTVPSTITDPEIKDHGHAAPPSPPITPSPPSHGAPSKYRRPLRRSATSPSPVDLSAQKSKSQRAIGIQASPNEVHLNVSSAKASKGLPSRPKRGSSPPRPGIGIARNATKSGKKDRPQQDEYVEFLRSGVRPEPQVVVRAAPEPLPPISADNVLLGRTSSYHGISRGQPSQQVQDDVGKIVVSPLGSPEKGWRHKEQSPQSNGSKM